MSSKNLKTKASKTYTCKLCDDIFDDYTKYYYHTKRKNNCMSKEMGEKFKNKSKQTDYYKKQIEERNSEVEKLLNL